MSQQYKTQTRRRTYNLSRHAHLLTFSCFKKQDFLNDALFCQFLSESINRSSTKYNFSVWAYVFMPNHVHLLVWPQEEHYKISDILASIKQPVSRKATGYLRRNEAERLVVLSTGQKHRPYRFWMKGRGYDQNIVKLSTLRQVVDYTHSNPVRKELVRQAVDWKWSSASYWYCGEEGAVKIDRKTFPG